MIAPCSRTVGCWLLPVLTCLLRAKWQITPTHSVSTLPCLAHHSMFSIHQHVFLSQSVFHRAFLPLDDCSAVHAHELHLCKIVGGSLFVYPYPLPIVHFTVAFLVTWPINASEAGGDMALIQTSLPFHLNANLVSITTT